MFSPPFFLHVLVWNRMCSVPNAFACVEINAIIRIWSFTHFTHTAIILNITVCQIWTCVFASSGMPSSTREYKPAITGGCSTIILQMEQQFIWTQCQLSFNPTTWLYCDKIISTQSSLTILFSQKKPYSQSYPVYNVVIIKVQSVMVLNEIKVNIELLILMCLYFFKCGCLYIQSLRISVVLCSENTKLHFTFKLTLTFFYIYSEKRMSKQQFRFRDLQLTC